MPTGVPPESADGYDCLFDIEARPNIAECFRVPVARTRGPLVAIVKLSLTTVQHFPAQKLTEEIIVNSIRCTNLAGRAITQPA